MKKLLLILLSVVLLVPLISPLSSSADLVGKDLPYDWENEGGEFFNDDGIYRIMEDSNFSEQEADKIFDAAPIMDNYITMENGTLRLNPSAETKVAPEVYEHYKNGVDIINEGVRDNVIYLDNETKTTHFVTSPEQMVLDSVDADPDSFWRRNWRGAKWYMSSRESKYYANKFSDRAFNWSMICAITAMIPGGLPAAIWAAIVAKGQYRCYTELRDNRSYRGSVLVFRWAPPKVYAYKR
ncbi:hypothetical protein CEH05_07400 [Halobacillus halophilus]|uniref:Uncharacterized protein n=1 Tax=Halobacillus halophilus (strain ATCC 35676 / DSM 2266 / JCM 20832 / KCTC 3685 / LMG 17431 / NBRC 102448 / NCIMB 2269) TaxID=866895 RepID=I0JL05_HALH3|nr:hypothetical protein [Halobacillus halophilus]ASF38946.1 hypothetical protein CEH05_07400 [Halobacillus halophilus]CCG44825.1 hypothetical protein HBHAL_2482 [Halobacillus halophilus DSM 2266]